MSCVVSILRMRSWSTYEVFSSTRLGRAEISGRNKEAYLSHLRIFSLHSEQRVAVERVSLLVTGQMVKTEAELFLEGVVDVLLASEEDYTTLGDCLEGWLISIRKGKNILVICCLLGIFIESNWMNERRR